MDALDEIGHGVRADDSLEAGYESILFSDDEGSDAENEETPEDEDLWLKVDVSKEGFAVTAVDGCSEGEGDWEYLDKVYLFKDEKTRSLSKSRVKVIALGLAQTLGGAAVTFSKSSGIAGMLGCFALQMGADTMRTGIVGRDNALYYSKSGLCRKVGKTCVLGGIGGVVSSATPLLPLYAQCCLTGALCSVSSELMDRKEAEQLMNLRKETPIMKTVVVGALASNLSSLANFRLMNNVLANNIFVDSVLIKSLLAGGIEAGEQVGDLAVAVLRK